MYRRILVATDHSAEAVAGARLARRLAAPAATMAFLHALPLQTRRAFGLAPPGLDPVGSMGGPANVLRAASATDEGRADEAIARREMESWLGSAGFSDAQPIVASGEAGELIVRHADEVAADLTVMGLRGQGRAERALMGSTAQHVLRKGRSDLLLARADVPERVSRVGIAVGFDPTGQHAARKAREVASQGELVLLHVWDADPVRGAAEGEGAGSGPQRFNAEFLGGAARIVEASGDPQKEILRFAERERLDLLVMGHHQQGFLARLLLDSVSEDVVAHAPCSLLLVRG